MTNTELFDAAYAQTQRAQELLEKRGDERDMTPDEAAILAKWLQDASCAARELANRKHGVPAPKRGD